MDVAYKTVHLRIAGMTCTSCQYRIEKVLYQTEGIKSAKVNYGSETAEIIFDTDKLSVGKIVSIINGLDYKVITGHNKKQLDIQRVLGLLVIIAAFYMVLQHFRILNMLAPAQLAETNMSYLRKQLTADVAHELRTPLTTVSTHLEMMLDGIWEPSPVRLQLCYDEIGRLEKLVADLERLAKSEGELLHFVKASEDLLEIVTAEAKNFMADIRVVGEKTVVPVDRMRIGQVIRNLISNAIQYGPEDVTILITVQNDSRFGKITVADNGSGIAESDLPFVFERFYRAEKSRNRFTGGIGLGLTISKNIVAAHNGSIAVESQIGKGSKFLIQLPK